MNKEYKKYKAKIDEKDFVIEQDNPDIGWYLYVYENGKCVKDHLQDDLETTKTQAKEEYGVPENAWTEL